MKPITTEKTDAVAASTATKLTTNRWFSTDLWSWLIGALTVLLVLSATWKLTIGNRVIARGDLLLYFYPLRDYASAAIRSGVFPLWNPFTFMGVPFLANSQVGFFYPFNIIFAWSPVGHAVSWNIAIHLSIAAAGAFILARTQLKLGLPASLMCALSFGLGGYLGAQVEHLNQLQVLAWLPLQLAIIGSITPRVRSIVRQTLWFSLLVGLQVLAGHTQSLYICMVTVGIVALIFIGSNTFLLIQIRRAGGQPCIGNVTRSRTVAMIVVVLAGIILAVLITAVQLAPTLELATQSARSGGLAVNEVGSFSWRPWVIARALLPTYGDPLFPEYVAYIGATGLSLALLGIIVIIHRSARSTPEALTQTNAIWKIVAIVLSSAGLILALGIATPVFNVLFRILPGFNLFRAQARWLVLFALGASMLIGYGTQALVNGLSRSQKQIWLFGWIALCVLVATGLLLGARFSPEAEYNSLPATPVIAVWFITAGLNTVILILIQQQRSTERPAPYAIGMVTLLLAELLTASQFQPYSRASDDQALTDLRPSTASLLSAGHATSNSGRVLALSGLFFDPGDLIEQRLIYQNQLSADELYDRVIASKQKEILSPNLSLYYRIPGVDGYDGGLLPLARYISLTQQLISGSGNSGAKPRALDGRLREVLTAVPEDTWLDKMAVRYIVTDKTRDAFLDDVYYDLQFPQVISSVLALPLDAFESTAIGLVLASRHAQPGDKLLDVAVYANDILVKTDTIFATSSITQPYFGARVIFEKLQSPTRLVLTAAMTGTTLLGMSSIDTESGAFQAQQIRADHNMRLVHSGDVKIYENQRKAPRAYIAALVECNATGGELSTTGSAGDDLNTGSVVIIVDKPERMELDVQAELPGYVVIRDAFYPGWVARVDNDNVAISPIDKLFRAIPVLPGKHRIALTYEPQSMYTGILLSIIGSILWLTISGGMLLRHRQVAAT